jgi:hypothetical protein
MKLAKSLLLASAAGFAAFGAQAADLPSKKAAPVEYVKVCPQYGAGFFQIPGSTTCLRVGGTAAFHAYGVTAYRQGTDAMASQASLTLTADARTATDYGLLRTFIGLTVARSSGSDDNSGSQPRRGQWFSGNGGYNNLQTGFNTVAWTQLGGMTFGRLNSVAAVGNPLLLHTTTGSSGGPVNQISYTQSFGGGVSATVAIEDAAELRNAVEGSGADGTVDAIPNNVPDLALSLDAAQSWGTFKLAGVVHNVAPAGRLTDASSKTGFAVMSQARINLPMLSPGSAINVYGAYDKGNSARSLGATATNTTDGNRSFALGDVNTGLIDAVQTATSLTLVSHWSVGGTLNYQATKALNTYLGGGYGRQEVPGSVANTSDVTDFTYWTMGLGAIWSPVAGFTINPEVAYRKLSKPAGTTNAGTSDDSAKTSDDQFVARLRVARTF